MGRLEGHRLHTIEEGEQPLGTAVEGRASIDGNGIVGKKYPRGDSPYNARR